MDNMEQPDRTNDGAGDRAGDRAGPDHPEDTGPGTSANGYENGPEGGSGQPNFVAFRVSGQDYCVDILAVREISQRSHVTPLPKSPRFISGVINLRGSVVPVLDCQVRFGLKTGETPSRQVIIVVQVDARIIGLLVDEVTEILNIPHEAVKPIPDSEEATPTPLVSGVIVKGTRIIRHIDLAQVVPEKELATA